jgi:hypothetical protein
VKNVFQKKIAKKLDRFSLANRSADEGLGVRANAWNFFLSILTFVSRGEMIGLSCFFFLLVGIEDRNVSKKKN